MARIFIYAETPGKNFGEATVDRESGQHTAEQLGEQVFFANSIGDVPKLSIDQTRISIMGHGLRDRMAFWDSPEECFNYIAALKESNLNITDVELIACNVGLVSESGVSFAKAVAEMIDKAGLEICLHAISGEDIYPEGGLMLITSKDDTFSLEHSAGLIEELRQYTDMYLPMMAAIDKALKQAMQDLTLATIHRNIPTKYEYLREDLYIALFILIKQGFIEVEKIENDIIGIDDFETLNDFGNALKNDSSFLSNTKIVAMRCSVNIEGLNVDESCGFNYLNHQPLDDCNYNDFEIFLGDLEVKRDQFSNERRVLLGKDKKYSLKNIRGILEPFNSGLGDTAQYTRDLFFLIAKERMVIDEKIRRSVGDDVNLIAEEVILKAASDYLLEPYSVQAFSSFCNTYTQHKAVLPQKSQVHHIVDEMLLLAAEPEYAQNPLKIYGDDRDRLTHPYLTGITRDIYSHIESIQSDLDDPTKKTVYTDMLTIFKSKSDQEELAREVRQKKIEVLKNAINYLKNPELLERYEALQESLNNNKEYKSSGNNTHKLIKEVVKIAEENFAMKELIDLSKIESHLGKLKEHISIAKQAKKDISIVQKDLNALEDRLLDIQEILEENLGNNDELVNDISSLKLELKGIEDTLNKADKYYKNKKSLGDFYEEMYYEDEDWTCPNDLKGDLTNNFNNFKEKYQDLKQHLHEQDLKAQQQISLQLF